MENGLGGSKGIAGKGHKDHIVIKTARFASISRVAQWQQNNGGGGSVVFPAKHVSGGELKKALDLMFQNQYSVQVRKRLHATHRSS